jgi:pSer/pThr/pTyr-binding forkhead associated (FHA) protein
VSGPLAGQTIDVEDEVVIGREGTDLTIDDQDVSRRHAAIRPSEGRLQVEDLGSTNGTFVDGNRIEEPTLIGGGAEIQLGGTRILVEGVLPARESSGDSQTTRQRSIPPEFQKQKAQEAVAPAPPAAPARPTAASPPRPAEPLAPFHPPEHGRQRGLASRSWTPVLLSYGSVILTAIALVLYFALR